MTGRLAATIAFVLCAGPVLAAAQVQDDTQRGNALLKTQDWDLAAESFSNALARDPRDKAAYVGRGLAEVANTDTDAAIADYDRALALGPAADIYRHRGEAKEENLDFDGAIADYGAAIRLDANYADAVGLRGRSLAVLGRYDPAARDLERATALSPNDAAIVLWLHIVHLRTHRDDRAWFGARVAHLNLNRWPGPALAYFAGQIPADDMTSIALKSVATARWHQRCDGWFYLGEEAAARGDTAKARELFRQTVTHCNAVDYEWDAAHIELKRLGF
jgi:lipoprotein NlpI